MFCSRNSATKINTIHKRALRAVTGAWNDSLDELLQFTNDIKIHQRNINALLTEIFKCLFCLSPEVNRDLFIPKTLNYSLRTSYLLTLPKTRTLRFGTNSLIFRGSQLWNSLPDCVKLSE